MVQCRKLLSRLTRSLDAIADGHLDAIEDVSALTRTTLAFGKGDNAAERLRRSLRLDHPVLVVSRPPEDERGTHIAFGGMAEVPRDTGGTISVTLERWLRSPAVIVKGARRRSSTWEQFITQYGNTYGSHVSEHIPGELTRAGALMHARQVPLADYLVHAAGVVAESCLIQLIEQVDGRLLTSSVNEKRLSQFVITAAAVVNLPEREILTDFASVTEMPYSFTFTVNTMWSADKTEDATLLMFRAGEDGDYLRLLLNAGGGEARIEVAPTLPDWWASALD